MKQLFLLLFSLLCSAITGKSQITAPTTATVGAPVTFTAPSGQQTYTWSLEPVSLDMPVSVTRTEVASVTQPQHVSILNDKGHWYAFCIAQNTRALMRIDLGANPTVPSVNVTNLGTFTTLTKTEIGTTFIYNDVTGNWHGFIAQIGDATNGWLLIKRLDFGNSLANTPTLVTVNIPAASGAQVCDISVVKEDNEYIMFVTHRGGPPTRVDLGTDITNINPLAVIELPAASTRITSLALYKQNGLWYGLMVHTDNGTLRRYDFGTAGLKNNTPAVTTVGSNVLGAGNNWAIRIVSGDCGKELVAYVHSGSNTKRLDFNGDITSIPAAAVTVGSSNVGGTIQQGLYPYVYRDTLYAMISAFSDNKIYNMKLSDLPSGSVHKYADPVFTHTFSTTGTYNVSLVVNMDGNYVRTFCHTIDIVTPAPAQPAAYTVAKPTVCAGESNVTYTVPAVTDAVSYDWQYTGTGVSFSANTSTPSNTLGFAGNAINGILQVRAVNSGGSAGPWRDTTIIVNALPTVTSTNTGARSICANDSLQLTAGGSSGVSYQWKRGTTNVGTNSATYYARTVGNYTVTVTNTSTNCSATSTPATVLTVNDLPTVASTNTGARSICVGDSLQLTASGSSGVSYQWKEGGTNVGTGTTWYAKTAGTYTVTATNTTTQCAATSAPATVLAVHPLPVVSVTAGGATEVCTGETVILTATGGSGIDYQWKDGATHVGVNANSYMASVTGSYKVVATNSSTGCSDSTTPVDVFVYDRPVASLDPGDTAFCNGGLVTLEVESQDTGLTYLWMNAGTMIPLASAYFLEITETGVYTVVVGRSSVPGCEDTTNEVAVTVHPLPVVNITWDGVLLHATPGHSSYQWLTGGQGIAGATDSIFEPTSDGGYSVAVTDDNGCTATSAVYNVTKVSVAEIALSRQASAYPNPASSVLYVRAEIPVQATLSTADGRSLLMQSGEKILTFDLEGYPDGLYILRITDGKGMYIRNEKIMIKNYR